MRHRFLLDENILYFAIRGVDRHEKRDFTAAHLVLTIAQICHSLVVHTEVLARYTRIPTKVKRDPPPFIEPNSFIRQLLTRADKWEREYQPLPPLPEGCDVPYEDEYIVRAALVSHPLLVTGDERLYDALKKHPELEIDVLWPDEALERASERPQD